MTIPTRYNGENIDASWFNAIATEISSDSIPNLTITSANSPYTPTVSSLIYCKTGSGNIIINIPLAADNDGRRFTIVKISSDSNTITISRAGSDTINGNVNYIIKNQNDGVILASNGNNKWQSIAGPVIRNFAQGNIGFGDSDGSITNNQDLYWDNVNKRLGVKTNSPTSVIDCRGEGKFGATAGTVFLNSSGVEIKDNAVLKLQNTGNTFNINVKAPSGLATTWEMTLPTTSGTNQYFLKTNGSGVTSWSESREVYDCLSLKNISIVCSESSGALTVTMNGHQGTALSSTNQGLICFRNDVLTSGNIFYSRLSSNKTLTIPAGASLGSIATSLKLFFRIYVYAQYSSTTDVNLFVSGSILNELNTITTNTISSGSDDIDKAYATTGAGPQVYRLIGYIDSTYNGSAWSTPTYVTTKNLSNVLALEQTNENILHNSQFQIMQRADYTAGTVDAVDETYYFDRWLVDTTGISSLKIGGITSDLPQIQNRKTLTNGSLMINKGANTTGYFTEYQKLEYSSKYYGKNITISGWVRSNNANARILMYDGTSIYGATAHSGSGEWEYLTSTFFAPSSGSFEFYVGIISAGGSTVSVLFDDYFRATALKMEVSSYATKYDPIEYEKELRECQRFYYRFNFWSVGYKMPTPLYPTNTAIARAYFPTPVPFRAAAFAGSDATSWTVLTAAGVAIGGVNTLASGTVSQSGLLNVRINNSTSSFVNNNTYGWISADGTYIDFSADL